MQSRALKRVTERSEVSLSDVVSVTVQCGIVISVDGERAVVDAKVALGKTLVDRNTMPGLALRPRMMKFRLGAIKTDYLTLRTSTTLYLHGLWPRCIIVTMAVICFGWNLCASRPFKAPSEMAPTSVSRTVDIWLRFENLGYDQTIRTLGAMLLKCHLR